MLGTRKQLEAAQANTSSNPNTLAGKNRQRHTLEMTTCALATAKPPPPPKQSTRQTNKRRLADSPKIWRTRQQLETIAAYPPTLTAHKMSSVGNAFASDDLYGSFERSDPLILLPQHTEVLRSSPLSIPEATFITERQIIEELSESENEDEFEEEENAVTINTINAKQFHVGQLPLEQAVPVDYGMAWNPRQNQWISLIYRYVFPASAFDLPKSMSKAAPVTNEPNKKQIHKKSLPSFAFPPPQESIMMGSDSLKPAFTKEQISSEAEAREACQKLLELIDDETLMLPSIRSSTSQLKLDAPTNSNTNMSAQNAPPKSAPLRSLHSEWSSLPSSPPPPIFHDVCNRPIPELRLSPPATAKQGTSAKKLFSAQQHVGTESPLTKRLRMSSSASSSSLA